MADSEVLMQTTCPVEMLDSVTAAEICEQARELVGGDRARTHGDKVDNHQNIANLWGAYLRNRFIKPAPGERQLDAHDVAQMMALLKIARTCAGEHNPDDYVDGAGYQAVAGEIAARTRTA